MMWRPGVKAAIGLAALAAVCAAASSPPAQGRAKLSCRSGKTEFQRGKTRIFRVTRGRDFPVFHYYGCSARVRRPRHFHEVGEGNLILPLVAGPGFGHRVLIQYHWDSEGGESGHEMGWWDERDARVRWGTVYDASPDAVDVDATAIAADGAIALAFHASEDVLEPEDPGFEAVHEQRIGVMCRGKRQLTRPHILARFDRRTATVTALSISGTTIRWRTKQGTQGSIPRACRGTATR